MLKKIRVLLAVSVFVPLCFFFLDFALLLPGCFQTLAAIQLIPALLAANLGILILLALLTFFCGRVYCSIICPLGILQDIITRIAARTKSKRQRFRYAKEQTILRWCVVAFAGIGFAFGGTVILSLLDPYSLFGRIAVNILRPVYLVANNMLEILCSFLGAYTFYRMDTGFKGLAGITAALASLALVGTFAWKYGRGYCNTICPVGTVLGVISRLSLFQIRFDAHRCNNCGQCEMGCKSSCINAQTQTIDPNRCVACFNCLEACPKDALHYAMPSHIALPVKNTPSVDTARRSLMLAVAGAVAAVPAKAAEGIGAIVHANATSPNRGALPLEAIPTRQHPVSPPGANSTANLNARCTACHLCVSKCPSNVLRPAFLEYGVFGMLQPVMNFDAGFCNYKCTICTEICPNGALTPLTTETKQMTQTGRVAFIKEICIVHTKGTSCGACAEHCPTQAVTMTPSENGLTIPVIDPDICVGCGGCEFICPTRPHRAIYVEGNPVHKQRKAIEEKAQQEKKIDSFGF